MTPPPPGLFSTTAVCLRFSCNPVAISRATTSLEPPGVNGTMMRMVLLGKLCALPCAWAVGIEATMAMASAASSRVMHPHNCGANACAVVLFWRNTLPQSQPGCQTGGPAVIEER